MLQWTAQLETGHPQIDEEHRVIFSRLNEIGEAIRCGADPEALSRLIVVLLDYAYLHFHHEEHAMACARCPHHHANCEAHRTFIERLKVWLAIINTGVVPISLIADIHAETCRWIEAHIGKIDVGLREAPPAALQPALA